MVTQDQIFNLRLRIKDPQGFIQFLEVADKASLPASPASQTAYKVTADGNYYSTEKTLGAVEADYSTEELYISDTTLSLMIDTYGEDGATCKALQSIIASITYEMRGLKSNKAGADTTEYQGLKDILDAYKYLLDLCSDNKKSNENNNSGRYMSTCQPIIGGGNL